MSVLHVCLQEDTQLQVIGLQRAVLEGRQRRGSSARSPPTISADYAGSPPIDKSLARVAGLYTLYSVHDVIRQAVIYARISVATEESVSVARQLESGRSYAVARNWEVVGEYVDSGVSATRLRPSARLGWQRLQASPRPFQAVVVWKVDRLTRRTLDFLQVHNELQERGAAIVCVEQSIDMTTGEGRAFAQMLAVFSELEAATISSRRRAARAHLIAHGRSPGGLQPYGWRIIPNPHGPGKVQAQDAERIGWVRDMAARALRGDTVYSIVRWLNDAEAPPPRFRKPGNTWGYSAVQTLLANPVLAGMTPCNPDSKLYGRRGPGLLRGADGAPVVRGELAIISVAEHERLLYLFSHKTHHAAVPLERRKRSSPLLSLMATCAECDVHLVRYTHARDKVGLRCKRCGQVVAMHLLAAYLEERLLRERGRRPMYRRSWSVPTDARASRKLASLDSELRETALALTVDGADTPALGKEIAKLKQARAGVRRMSGAVAVQELKRAGKTVAEVWAYCSSDEQRREVLRGQVQSLVITRGRYGGRGLDAARVSVTWRLRVKAIVPDSVSLDGPPPRRPALPPTPWVTQAEAALLLGWSLHTVRKAADSSQIERRVNVHRSLPSLSRASVMSLLV